MKTLPSLLALAALCTISPVRAETKPDAQAATAIAKKAVAAIPGAEQKAKTEAEKLKEKKDADRAASLEEKKKVHTLAVMEVTWGREAGQVMFELFPEDAPKTVENFRSNAEKGLYNGLAVHRAIKEYLVQTGDPASKDDKARESWGLSQEYTIPGEFKRPHTVGAVAMARRSDKVNPEKKSDGSQFYFVLGNMSALDGQYTVFGQVVAGMDVLRKISRTVTDSNDCPVVRVNIKKVVVVDQTGPVVAMQQVGKHKRQTKPDALKGPIERFLERIW